MSSYNLSSRSGMKSSGYQLRRDSSSSPSVPSHPTCSSPIPLPSHGDMPLTDPCARGVLRGQTARRPVARPAWRCARRPSASMALACRPRAPSSRPALPCSVRHGGWPSNRCARGRAVELLLARPPSAFQPRSLARPPLLFPGEPLQISPASELPQRAQPHLRTTPLARSSRAMAMAILSYPSSILSVLSRGGRKPK